MLTAAFWLHAHLLKAYGPKLLIGACQAEGPAACDYAICQRWCVHKIVNTVRSSTISQAPFTLLVSHSDLCWEACLPAP